jgi:UDP-4-amino-4,6-dideoxy-N-acetyl-beta-L-altrosamine transaminase
MKIPYGRQSIDEADIQAVVDVLRSDFLTQGPEVEKFEAALCEKVNAPYGRAFNSATSALHAAYLSVGVSEGDLVWTSPITFVATSNAALHCGAKIDFVDVNASDANMDMQALEFKLKHAATTGKLPKLVVPVHMCGYSNDMQALHKLSLQYGFRIVEDASHAVGATYQGRPVGSCEYSSATVFSFHPVKIVTTGEGGAVMTKDAAIAQRLTMLRSHGITRDAALMEGVADGPWYYQQQVLGYNYRMTDFQAALGTSQLRKLRAFIIRRNELAERYHQLLADLPLHLPHIRQGDVSAYHLYVVQLDEKRTSMTRAQIFESLRSAGIGANVHYIPVHTQPYYKRLGFKENDFPQSVRYYAGALTLPLFPTMTEEEQDFVVSSLRAALK